MKLGFSFLVFFLLISVYGCSDKNTGIKVRLPDNQRLEDTPAGWWIKELGLHYDAQSKYLTEQMHNHLVERAKLLEKYRDDDDALTAIWEYYSKSMHIVIEEKIYKSSDGETIWMKFRISISWCAVA